MSGTASATSPRRTEDLLWLHADGFQCLQCILTGELLVISGGLHAKEGELFDLVDHDGHAVLLGRHGTDETRTIWGVDDLFQYKVGWESREGYQEQQMRLIAGKARQTDRAATYSMHKVWVGDVFSAPHDPKVLQISNDKTGHQSALLEWFFTRLPLGNRPAITAWCGWQRVVAFVHGCADGAHDYDRTSKCLTMMHRELLDLGLEVDSLMWPKRGRAWRRGRGEADSDLGPNDACSSASSLCVLLVNLSRNKRHYAAYPGMQERCMDLMSALLGKFFGSGIWCFELHGCQLQIVRGLVNIQQLLVGSLGQRWCRRTCGWPMHVSIALRCEQKKWCLKQQSISG